MECSWSSCRSDAVWVIVFESLESYEIVCQELWVCSRHLSRHDTSDALVLARGVVEIEREWDG